MSTPAWARRTLRLAGWLGRRLLRCLPVVFGIALLNFAVLQLAPGDVVDVLAGEAGAASPEYMAALRQRFGLDQPLLVQLGHYLWGLLQLDLGFSFRHNLPVRSLILQRLPCTLLLMLLAMGLALVGGLLLGTLSAWRAGRWTDRLISAGVLVVYATPSFWLGLMAAVLFSARLGWLPSGGMEDVGQDLHGLAHAGDVLRHALLPAATLAGFYLAVYTKLTRASLLELSGADFIRTARAKGAGEWRVTWHHALRNALLPLVSMLGYQLSSLLSGAVLVESVFSWPGLGRLAFDSILARDFNLLMGILFMSSWLVILMNLLADLACAWADPRIRLQGVRP